MVLCQVPIDADLLADGDGLSAAEQVTYHMDRGGGGGMFLGNASKKGIITLF